MKEFPEDYADFESFALEVVGRGVIENSRKGSPEPMESLAMDVTKALLASRAAIVPSSPPMY
ncbi:MAG: hypothetical protein ACYDBP_08550 [Leptospirales bacterium]